MRRFLHATALIAAAAAMACGTGIQAATIPIGTTVSLAELIDSDHTIVAGDKQFDDFEYSPSANAPDPEEILVRGVSRIRNIDGQPTNVFGLLFTSGEFAAGGFSGTSLDASLLFRVSVTDPEQSITGVELAGTTVVSGSGDARIAESFANVSGPTLLIRQFRVEGDLIQSKTMDFTNLGKSVKELYVQKDISIEVPPEGHALYDLANLAEVTTFTQLFYQTAVIPEPAAATLLLGGMLGAAVLMRFRLG